MVVVTAAACTTGQGWWCRLLVVVVMGAGCVGGKCLSCSLRCVECSNATTQQRVVCMCGMQSRFVQFWWVKGAAGMLRHHCVRVRNMYPVRTG